MSRSYYQPVLVDAVCNSTEQCKQAFEEAKMDYIPDNHSHATCVNLLIQAGADVNVKAEKGVTTLISAARSNHDDCVDLLIKAEADMNQGSDDGSTPLTSAVGCGSTTSLEKLLFAGADVNATCKEGFSSLNFSAMFDRDAILKAGTDINVKENIGSIALLIVSTYGHVKCLQQLTQAGADVNTKYHGLSTALIRAAYLANFKCIEHLLNAGVDVNGTTNTCKTALLSACMHKEGICRSTL